MRQFQHGRENLVQGLSHMTFIVSNLDRTQEILEKVFGAQKVYDSGDDTFSLSKERFFLVGDGNMDRDYGRRVTPVADL